MHATADGEPLRIRYPIQGRRANIPVPPANTLVHGLMTHDHEHLKTLPGATANMMENYKREWCLEDVEQCVAEMNSTATWCGPLHVRTFCCITAIDVLAFYNQTSSWFVMVEAQPNTEKFIAVDMEMKAYTHANAYVRDIEGFEDAVWRTFFHVILSRFPDELKYRNVTRVCEGRQVAKLAEILEIVPKPTGAVLELGCAPGAWHKPLKTFSAGHPVTAVSPVGEGYLALHDSINPDEEGIVSATIATFDAEGQKFALIVSDAATEDSWKTNDTFAELMSVVDVLAAPEVTVVVKVSNYTLTTFDAQYSEFARKFKYTTLFKPKHSRIFNSEAYAVGIGYGASLCQMTQLVPFITKTTERIARWYKTGTQDCDITVPRMVDMR